MVFKNGGKNTVLVRRKKPSREEFLGPLSCEPEHDPCVLVLLEYESTKGL